jgi:DNA-binding MarR family transcriptional regulator
MINRIDQVMGGIFNVTVQSLNSREQRDMAQFFETVARGYGCTVIRVRSGESRLRACHRQMARVLGLLSNNVYGSTMTRAQWSILEAIIRAPEAISANILEGYLGVRSALISEILTSFEAHGFIEKTRSLENHRVNLLHPTALGRRQFRRLETQAVLRLKRCLQGYSPKELLHLYGILKKFAGEWGQDSIFLAQSLVTRPITETEIRAVRAFALRSIVARGWEYDAPETLLPSDRQIWGLFDQGSKLPEIKALCVAKPERLGWTVEFAIWHDSLSRSQFNAFVQYSHYLSYRGKAPAPLLINFEPLNR